MNEDEYNQSLDDKYCDMFNSGYLLAKHKPDLFKLIESKLDEHNPLLHGKQQYEIEKAKDYFKKFDKGEAFKEITKDKSKDDKGMNLNR